jgi:hypothetical protein
LGGKIGEKLFCNNCEFRDVCDKNYRKIPRWIDIAIEFFYRNRDTRDYVFPGSYLNQPVWLMDCQPIIIKAYNEAEKRKRKDK